MAAAAGVEERERTLQAAATGLKTSLVDPEKVHVAVNGRCQANLVCIICWAVEHTRMTVRFVKVFLRLKFSGRNDPKRWHVGHVNQAVCMKLFWLLHWNLRWHRDCCPCHWYFPLIAWYGRILMADCAFPPHRKRHDLVAGSVIWEHCNNSAGKVSIRSYWHQI